MAIQKLQVYRCQVCGNIVEVVTVGGGTLVCCNQPMNLLPEQTADSSKEKHVPLIEKTDCGYKVTVGSTLHPMTDAHYIMWIELQVDNYQYRAYLAPGQSPIVDFCVPHGDKVIAREYCNLHGLWKS